ncbi:MAG: histidine kinase dimerization/phospho-acceptor domain-containing protein, partial [Acidobacteriota bacterium]
MIKSAEDIYLDKGLLSLQKEVKKMFLRLQNDINYLKRLEKVRSEFLGNVSHELRTPIFTIQGFIETLLDGAIDDPRVNRS